MTPQEFSSSQKIGDWITVNLHESGEFFGQIVGVKFQLGKVYYDIDVYPFKSEETNKHLSFRFRDIDSYFISSN